MPFEQMGHYVCICSEKFTAFERLLLSVHTKLISHSISQPKTPKVLHLNYLTRFQRFLTAAWLKWMVGAWGIQGLPLCPASPQIEYSPHGWQIPATQPWAPFQAPVNTVLIRSVGWKIKNNGEGGGMLENNCSKLLRTTEKPAPKLHWNTNMTSCNIPCEPILVKLTTG